MRIPAALASEWREEADWLAALPRLAAECAERWGLVLEDPVETPNSLVVPAGAAVLKLNAPTHREADHEADALAFWEGAGSVRLLARDDARRALLLERCRPGTALRDAGVEELPVLTALIARLRRELHAAHPFRLLADEADGWAEELPARYEQHGGRPFERPILDAALDVFRGVDRRATALVNQDLHAGNVLRAEREPWLVIDPKPLAGEPELDGVGLLRNAAWSAAPATAVRRTLDALGELGLDLERTRGWGAAHTLAWSWDEREGRWWPDGIEAVRTILQTRA